MYYKVGISSYKSFFFEYFKELSMKYNISINHTEILPEYYKTYYNSLLNIVKRTKDQTRVYVFIGENVALLELMSIFGDLHEKNDLNMEEYVILAVDNSIDDNMQEGIYY